MLIAAPVKPLLPELPDPVSAVRSAAVDLSAAVSPLVVSARNDVAGIASLPTAQIAALPTPGALLAVAQALIAQFADGLKEAPGQLNLAIQQVLAGQITQALNTAANVVLTPVTGPVLDAIFSGTGPFVDLIDILQSSVSVIPPLANVVGLLKNPDFLLTVGLPLLQSVYSINSSIGGAAESVLAAAQAGNLGGVVEGVIKGLVDLQGVVMTQLFAAGTAPYYYDRGLVGNLIAAGQMIINALVTPATASTAAARTAEADSAAPETAAVANGEDAEGAAVKEVSAAPEATGRGTAAPEPVVESAPAAIGEPTADDVAVSVEPKSSETTAAEEVSTTPVDEPKAASTPEVRTGLVAVPGKVTVGVAKDEEPSASKADAEPVSTTSESKDATAASADASASSGSTASSPSGSAGGGSTSGSSSGGTE